MSDLLIKTYHWFRWPQIDETIETGHTAAWERLQDTRRTDEIDTFRFILNEYEDVPRHNKPYCGDRVTGDMSRQTRC